MGLCLGQPPLSDAAREELQQSLLPTEARSVSVEVPMARLGFDEVVERALAYNSTALLARSETRRLIAVMEQARASSLPTLTMAATYNRLDGDRVLGTGDTQRLVAGANSSLGNVTVQVPLLAPARWAQWLHADDNVKVAEISAQDARQKVAVAAARGYLLVLMQRRQVEVASRSEDSPSTSRMPSDGQRAASAPFSMRSGRAQTGRSPRDSFKTSAPCCIAPRSYSAR